MARPDEIATRARQPTERVGAQTHVPGNAEANQGV